ncbi:G-protein coupled receptor Mth2 isoform X2 [Leptinotarsa decemlineata]|uniref:G-protein coupled receptor Mth2 isoform X2 n=1 Tax=Leptinotarsa decemlineata TaxID=7539 RepID=UPI003D30D0B5
MFRFFFLLLFYPVTDGNTDCSSGFQLNISDGLLVNNDIVKNGVTFSADAYFYENDTLWGCICSKKCVQKCCSRNQAIFDDLCVYSENESEIRINVMEEKQTDLVERDVRVCDRYIYITESQLWKMIGNGSITIDNNINHNLAFDEFCLDTSLNDQLSLFMCVFDSKSPEEKLKVSSSSGIMVNQCEEKVCVRKCCGPNEIFSNDKTCVNQNDPFHQLDSLLEGIHFTKQTHHLIFSELNCANDSQRFATTDFELDYNGSLNWEGETVQINRYCLDVILDEDGNYTLKAVICEKEDIDVIEEHLHHSGMIISMPFLLATFLVYALLPEPNLHRRALMSYVATLLMGYILLVSVQLSSEGISDVSCNLLGYLIIFFFTVSFFWMNVMCIDMWLAFRGMRSFGDRKGAERKRFIIYCCYAWGMPLVDILIIFLLNTYGDQTSSYYPAIGIQRCFVGEGLPNFLYFYLLAMLILIINIVLFILTGFKIHKVQRETSVLKHSDSKRHAYEDDKQQYKLYVKLLFAMGVNWITEIISWAIGYFWQETPKAVFYFTDFINATYGVFIFFIFVFKRKIWTSLKKRYWLKVSSEGFEVSTPHSSNFRLTQEAVYH